VRHAHVIATLLTDDGKQNLGNLYISNYLMLLCENLDLMNL